MKLRCLLLLFCGLLYGVVAVHAQPLLPKPVNLEESLKKARVSGKYAMLLAQIAVPGDTAKFGEFNDKGFDTTAEYAGMKGLPAGYWVYVSPYWYIWRDVTPERRAWGPEQATGEPDTTEIGDIQTAWASRAPDDQPEWLLAEFATPVNATSVKIYETFNPGAISKITAFGLDGKENEIWAGEAAPVAAAAVVVNQKEFPHPLKTNRVKIYIDSQKVPTYNEIDAIGLVERDGKVQWASKVACSSTYAEQNVAQPGVTILDGGFIPALPNGQNLQLLQQQLRQMQVDINELRQRAGLPARPLPADPNVDLLLNFNNWGANNFFGAGNQHDRAVTIYNVKPGGLVRGNEVIPLPEVGQGPVIITDGVPVGPLQATPPPAAPPLTEPGKVTDKPK